MNATDHLMQFRRCAKLHEHMLKKICDTYHLSLLEGTVLCFLHNNPDKDTATDIVELRMLSKGNVSQAVESLSSKGFLQRTADTANRRKIHLSLLPKAQPVTREIDAMLIHFRDTLFLDFSPEEMEMYAAFCQRIIENTKKAMKEDTLC